MISGAHTPAPKAATATSTSLAQAATPLTATSTSTSLATSNPVAQTRNPAVPVGPVEATAPVGQREDPEQPAVEAFTLLTQKIQKLDAAEQPAAIEQFITTYPNSIVAARARRMLADLKTQAAAPPPTPTATATPTNPPATPATPATPANSTAPAPLAESKPPAPPVDPSLVAFAEFETEFIAALRARQIERLTTLFAQAEKTAALSSRQKDLATLHTVLDWFAELKNAVGKGIQRLKTVDDFKLPMAHGEAIHVGVNAPFKFADVKDDAINLTNQGLSLAIPVASLPEECVTRLSLLGLGESPHVQALKAFSALPAGDRALDSAAIKSAQQKMKSAPPQDQAVFQALLAVTESLASHELDLVEIAKLCEHPELDTKRLEQLRALVKLVRTQCSPRMLAAYAAELTAADLILQEPDPKNLLAHWTFDSVDGATVNDSSGMKNNGTLVNSPALVPGKIGQAASFNGVDQFLRAPAGLFHAHRTLSIALWFNTTMKGAICGCETRDFPETFQESYVAVAYIGVDGRNRGKFWNGNQSVQEGPVVTDGKWHHLAICVGAAEHRMYIDGTVTAVYPGEVFPLNMLGNQFALAFTRGWAGSDATEWSFFKGLLDDIRLYDRALTESEVQALARKPKSSDKPNP